MPGVRSLDDPTAWLAAKTSDEWWFATPADVRRDAPRSNGRFNVRVVVALVEAKMLRAARTARATQNNRVERGGHEPLVMNVRAGDLCGQRDPTPVREDVTLHAALGTIGRIRTRQIPPFGAFTVALSNELQAHWIPRVTRRPRAEVPRECLPLAARSEPIHDAGHHHAIGDARAATAGLRSCFRQQRLDPYPERIRQLREPRFHSPSERRPIGFVNGVVPCALIANARTSAVESSRGAVAFRCLPWLCPPFPASCPFRQLHRSVSPTRSSNRT